MAPLCRMMLVPGGWCIMPGLMETNPPGREMLLDRLVMGEDGWPSVAGRVPSHTPRMGPVIK